MPLGARQECPGPGEPPRNFSEGKTRSGIHEDELVIRIALGLDGDQRPVELLDRQKAWIEVVVRSIRGEHRERLGAQRASQTEEKEVQVPRAAFPRGENVLGGLPCLRFLLVVRANRLRLLRRTPGRVSEGDRSPVVGGLQLRHQVRPGGKLDGQHRLGDRFLLGEGGGPPDQALRLQIPEVLRLAAGASVVEQRRGTRLRVGRHVGLVQDGGQVRARDEHRTLIPGHGDR